MASASHDDLTNGLTRLRAIVARLRGVEGDKWAQAQDFVSLAPYAIEEAYELAESIESNQADGICDELGDLLLQIIFHAELAEETGIFCFDDIVAGVIDKLERRHPHIFAPHDNAASPAPPHAASPAQWEATKARERAESGESDASLMDNVSPALPGLTRSMKLQARAAQIGFDWDTSPPILAKLAEEIDELRAEIDANAPAHRLQDELGDVLFVLANLARHLEIDAEASIRAGNRKFISRFKWMEGEATRLNIPLDSLSLSQLEALWQAAKREQAAKANERATD